jgi:hypothetical protein
VELAALFVENGLQGRLIGACHPLALLPADESPRWSATFFCSLRRARAARLQVEQQVRAATQVLLWLVRASAFAAAAAAARITTRMARLMCPARSASSWWPRVVVFLIIAHCCFAFWEAASSAEPTTTSIWLVRSGALACPRVRRVKRPFSHCSRVGAPELAVCLVYAVDTTVFIMLFGPEALAHHGWCEDMPHEPSSPSGWRSPTQGAAADRHHRHDVQRRACLHRLRIPVAPLLSRHAPYVVGGAHGAFAGPPAHVCPCSHSTPQRGALPQPFLRSMLVGFVRAIPRLVGVISIAIFVLWFFAFLVRCEMRRGAAQGTTVRASSAVRRPFFHWRQGYLLFWNVASSFFDTVWNGIYTLTVLQVGVADAFAAPASN